jgi:hypothetical protein
VTQQDLWGRARPADQFKAVPRLHGQRQISLGYASAYKRYVGCPRSDTDDIYMGGERRVMPPVTPSSQGSVETKWVKPLDSRDWTDGTCASLDDEPPSSWGGTSGSTPAPCPVVVGTQHVASRSSINMSLIAAVTTLRDRGTRRYAAGGP